MSNTSGIKNGLTDNLFKAILSLKSVDECYEFFEDICTIKEVNDMSQRLQIAEMLLDGKTYDKIVKEVEISTATISRINRCIQYGAGVYKKIIERGKEKK